jgi:hypothetical protein
MGAKKNDHRAVPRPLGEFWRSPVAFLNMRMKGHLRELQPPPIIVKNHTQRGI